MNKKEKIEIFYELQKSQKNWEKGLDHKNQKTKFQIFKRKNQKFSMKGKITKILGNYP